MEKQYQGDFHIDFNETECQAMEAFLRGEGQEGTRLQEQFLAKAKEAMKEGLDHCPCQADCCFHGKCVLCVMIHRGHGNHLPACMQAMVNRRLESLSELTEHTIVRQVDVPDYLK